MSATNSSFDPGRPAGVRVNTVRTAAFVLSGGAAADIGALQRTVIGNDLDPLGFDPATGNLRSASSGSRWLV